jgi:alpha-D-xyloside xylohydrolase
MGRDPSQLTKILKAMIRLLIVAALVIGFSAPADKNWTKTDNGVLIKLKSEAWKGARLMKVEVLNNQIIHISATPGAEFSKQKSLIAVDRKNVKPKFLIASNSSALVLSTSDLKIQISLETGHIVFSDKDNNVLLQETSPAGKTFTPVTVEGTTGYAMRQVFESPDDEAFYGLGQHQSDEFNYKGKNEALYQYNTKVSVPFVVSSKNYGILWDNYSLTKFGDPRDYSDLDLFNLYDSNGKAGGLSETYYNASDTTITFLQRKVSSIDYENLETIKKFPNSVQLGRSKVIWNGKIEPKESGLFHFNLYYAGYVKLYIDNVPVVPERWRTAWNPNTYKFTKDMEKGKQYSLRIEWKPDGGTSYLGLKALSPLTPEEQGKLSLTSEMGDQIDYYFIYGNNLDNVISGYREVTGKAQVMPKWAMGYWQSRERYKSQDELVDVLKEYRERNIPIDNIVLDWSYWPVPSWGSHEFDPQFFPDPAGMVDQVHKLNAKIMISVWPKFYITTDHYKEFEKNGWMYKQAVRDSVRDWIGRGFIGSFYDPYSQGARDLFWGQIKEHLYSKGFDAWWMDASEPDILSNASLEYRKLLSTPTGLGHSTKYFNTYALMNAMTIYDGQRSAHPDKRVFLLTRSGFPGLQRYSTATWSGDIGTRWEDMKAQIPAGLNFAISGIPYWTMDIGGFCVENRYANAKEGSDDMEEWRELNTRWFQFGAFCPLFRSHGQFPLREIYNISPDSHPAYMSMVYYDKLRYSLMPYIYSLAGMTHFNDYTIMRPLIMDFNGDKKVNDIGDQYMFGPSLMVAPVYKYKARSREVYLPSLCGWYDFYSNKFTSGGTNIIADAPYERIPLFVREGTILPIGPDIQYTDQKPADPLTIFVYSGKNGDFTLYEDEGTNYNYEKGFFSTIRFVFSHLNNELTIEARKGDFPGMLKIRTFNIIMITKESQLAGNVIDYTGSKVVVPLGD